MKIKIPTDNLFIFWISFWALVMLGLMIYAIIKIYE